MIKVFDVEFYKKFHCDLENYPNDFLINHYKDYGKSEGRIISESNFYHVYPDFDVEFYKIFYGDLEKFPNEKLMSHYHYYGKSEGRIISESNFYKVYPDFDVEFYKLLNPEFKEISEKEIMSHYNILFNENNSINDNYVEHESIDNINLNHEVRNIKSHDSILKKFKNNALLICNKDTFLNYYINLEFDFNFYKNKYLKNTELSNFDILLYYHTTGKKLNHVYNEIITIIIYSLLLNNICGGIVVMHNLAKIINDMNIPNVKAKIANPFNIKYKNQFCENFANIHEINDNCITIYPEIIYGNPLNSKKVIRWILLDLGIDSSIDHYKNWSKTDLVYHWEPNNKNNYYFKQLAKPWFNPLFKNNNNQERIETCFLIKKAPLFHKNINYFHPNDSIQIDNINSKYLSILEINEIFNKCKYFYCYDPNSALIIFSAICGCIPIVYPIENINKQTYLQNRIMNCGEELIDFIAYGNDVNEIKNTEEKKKNMNYYINYMDNYYSQNIKNFIEDITKNYYTNNNIIALYYNCINFDIEFNNSFNNKFNNISNQEIIISYNEIIDIIEKTNYSKLNEFELLNHIKLIDNEPIIKIKNNLLNISHWDKISEPDYNNLYLSWINDSINNRKISIISPVSNEIIYTDKYFITNNLYNENTKYSICNYYFKNEEIILGLGLGTGNHPQEAHILYVYCIKENSIFYDWLCYSFEDFKDKLFVKILLIFNNIIKNNNFELLDNKITTIYGYMSNMGHMLFNEYSGLYLIDYNKINTKIDEVLFGNHDVYYIKKYFQQFKNINIIDNDDVKNIEIIGRGVFFKYNHNYILDDTISFLKNNLINIFSNNNDINFDYEYEKKNAELIRQTHYPIFNIILRKGSYEMVNQETTITNLINLLVEKYPNAFFYLDGFVNNSNDKDVFIEIDHSKKIHNIRNDYFELTNKIIQNINTQNIKSLINTNILHLITYIQNCNYGIYILGSAACNSAWICKTPGIQFGRPHIELYEYMDKLIRENNPDIIYLSHDITYNPTGNFNVEAETIFNLVPNF